MSFLQLFVVPLALIPTIASLIGYWLVGLNVPYWGCIASFEWGLNQSITSFVTSIAGILLSGWAISWLAPKFGTTVSLNIAVKMVAFSYAPFFVAGIFYIVPSLAVIPLMGGIYGLYILYLGFVSITGVQEEKRTGYFTISLIIMILLFILISLVVSAFLDVLGISAIKY